MAQLLTVMENEHLEHRDRPLLIHCSAGIGRTGTLMSMFFLMNMARRYKAKPQLTPNFSIFGTVRNLREQRMGLVQTAEQYNFLYSFMSSYVSKHFK